MDRIGSLRDRLGGAGMRAGGAGHGVAAWPRRHVPRLGRRARTMLIALCAAIAVFAAMTVVTDAIGDATATVPVVVTTRPVSRGESVVPQALTIADVPSHAALDDAVGSLEDAVGSVARIDLPSGGIVTAAMLADSPAVPDGYAEVAVTLASSTASLDVGGTVAVSGFCSAIAALRSSAADSSDSDGTGVCTIAADAVVIALGDMTGEDESSGTIRLAMPPSDALAVLAAADATPLVAIVPSEQETEQDGTMEP
ncbi:SAF domain-containing protein [Bifidobacterium choloepi]|uniref:SAF domain-containing protein n=1 Tax=Bifidobacterium choloepi TaxID=2614131 RepID=A0A6I5N221_9BIFI|nr:SAF domain-containing protein [Bifidobacterium choloepi]NEG69679.1 hypothetical protein [Bifidobacterium choloepi]